MAQFRLSPPPRILPPMPSLAIGALTAAAVVVAAPSYIVPPPPLPPISRGFAMPVRGTRHTIFSVASVPPTYATLVAHATPLPPVSKPYRVPLWYFLRHYLMAVNDVEVLEQPFIGGMPWALDGGSILLLDDKPLKLLDGGVIRRFRD